MGQQHINLGSTATGSDGDTNKTAWTKAEGNFNELYSGALAVSAFKNKIINGTLDNWQRETAATLAVPSGALLYWADRFATQCVGSSAVVSKQTFATGQTDVPGNPKFYHRTVVTSVAGVGSAAFTVQRIESLARYAGQTLTVSFYAKADSN